MAMATATAAKVAGKAIKGTSSSMRIARGATGGGPMRSLSMRQPATTSRLLSLPAPPVSIQNKGTQPIPAPRRPIPKPRTKTVSTGTGGGFTTTGVNTDPKKSGRYSMSDAVSRVAAAGTYGGATFMSAGRVGRQQRKTMEKQHNFEREMLTRREGAYEEAGLPKYVAHGGASFTPRVVQQNNGGVRYASNLPGNPQTSRYTGSPSQIGAGWGALF